jgi:polyphenol oxidase
VSKIMVYADSLQFKHCSGFSNPAVRTLLTTRFWSQLVDASLENSKSNSGPFNLATHVGDDPNLVARNRSLLRQYLPSEPLWLNQVHGIEVVDVSVLNDAVPTADAALTFNDNRVLAVLTADCLPVLFASGSDSSGLDAHAIPALQPQAVAVAHAGWRGLVNGVLEATVARMRVQLSPSTVIEAGFGAAIGPGAFEVGPEVVQAFCDQALSPEQLGEIQAAFKPIDAPQKWLANLYRLAQIRLEVLGVKVLPPPAWCTYRDEQLFFSHRRDTVLKRENKLMTLQAGRQASLIWLDPEGS